MSAAESLQPLGGFPIQPPASNSGQPDIDKVREKHAKDLIKYIENSTHIPPDRKMKAIKILQEGMGKTPTFLAWPLNFILFERKLKSSVAPILFDGNSNVIKAIDNMHIAALGLDNLGIAFEGGIYILKRKFLNEARKELEAFREELSNMDPNLEAHKAKEEEINNLEKWIKYYEGELGYEGKKLILTTTSNIPDTIKLGYTIYGQAIGSGVKGFLNVAGPIASVLATGYKYYAAKKYAKAHTQWVDKFREPTLDATGVKALLQKRTEQDDKMDLKAEEHFRNLIYNLQRQVPPLTGVELRNKLKEQGIHLEHIPGTERIVTLNDFVQVYKNNSAFADTVFGQFCDYRKTVAIMTKKALLGMVEGKHGLEGGVHKRKVALRKFGFYATLTVSALSLALMIKSTLIPGIAGVALLAVCSTGIGLLVIAGIVMLSGLAFLIWKRPNLFKTYLKLQQARLVFFEIPTAFRKWQLQKAENNLNKRIASHLTENDELEGKIEELKTKVHEWEEKLKPLKHKIMKAGWKDYLRETHLGSTYKGKRKPSQPLDPVEEVSSKLQFLRASNLVDDSLLNTLRDRFGIHGSKDLKDFGSKDWNDFEHQLKEFCAMDNEETSHFIKHQKARLDTGH